MDCQSLKREEIVEIYRTSGWGVENQRMLPQVGRINVFTDKVNHCSVKAGINFILNQRHCVFGNRASPRIRA